jgi:hypothetical protein
MMAGVFVFGGLSKLYFGWPSPDAAFWIFDRLSRHSLLRFLGHFHFVASSGIWLILILQLAVIFFLFFRRLKVIAIAVFLAFHAFNQFILFSPALGNSGIGVFGYLGMARLICFLEPDTPQQFFLAVRKKLLLVGPRVGHRENALRPSAVIFLTLFFGCQIAMAFLSFLPSAHPLPRRFSWSADVDRITGIGINAWVQHDQIPVPMHYGIANDLDRDQYFSLADPKVARDYARYLWEKFRDDGRNVIYVAIDEKYALNNHRYIVPFDPMRNVLGTYEKGNFEKWISYKN